MNRPVKKPSFLQQAVRLLAGFALLAASANISAESLPDKARADGDGYLASAPQQAASNLLAYVQQNNLDGEAELGEGAGSRRHRRLGSGWRQ
jgi:hypothetical protein